MKGLSKAEKVERAEGATTCCEECLYVVPVAMTRFWRGDVLCVKCHDEILAEIITDERMK
jgi:hypothetical protein